MSERVQLKRKSISAGPKGKPILSNKPRKTERNLLPIIIDGKDLTPKPLNPDLFTSGRERQLSVFDVSCSETKEPFSSSNTSTNFFKTKTTYRTELEKQAPGLSTSVFKGSLHYNTSSLENILLSECDDRSDTVKFSFHSNSEELDVVEDMARAPEHISLSLNETSTFILLDIPSSTALKDSDEGQFILFVLSFTDKYLM